MFNRDRPAQFKLSDFKIQTACYIATKSREFSGRSLDLETKQDMTGDTSNVTAMLIDVN